MDELHAYVVEARLDLSERCDPATIGAAVTAELCGHWEHEGACRWPHNNAVDAASAPARFRTLFVSREEEEAQVRERIGAALRQDPRWRFISTSTRPVAEDERALALRLQTAGRLHP